MITLCSSFPASSHHHPPLSLLAYPFHPPSPLLEKIDRRTKLVQTEDQQRLVDLESENLRLDQAQRPSVDLNEALAGLAVCDRSRGLLLAEALDGLRSRGHIRSFVWRIQVLSFGVGGELAVSWLLLLLALLDGEVLREVKWLGAEKGFADRLLRTGKAARVMVGCMSDLPSLPPTILYIFG